MEAQHQQLSHFAGFDWAKDHHDIVVVERDGRIVADFRIEHTAAGWRQWADKIKQWPALGVAVETNQGAAVEQLVASGVKVYPVQPLSAKSYRQRKAPSGTKTDRLDAWSMADALRTDGHAWRPLGAEDPILAELRILCRDEVALIEERTALINQLQQALLEYYPTALEAFDDWTLSFAWAFVEAFPSGADLKKAGKRKWENFLHKRGLNRPQTYQKRMDAFAKAGEWSISAPVARAKSKLALARARQLRVLQQQLDDYRQSIEELFASHPDSGTFGSLPGAGPKLAPRLLAEIGSDRGLYESAAGLQLMAGTAPSPDQSGKKHHARFRRACNKHLRYAMHLFADKSRAQCSWAAAYYDKLSKKDGKSHAWALRCLGQRWLKIIWKMWQTKETYDGEKRLRDQLEHGSWVLAFIPKATA
jgi:transposase